MQYIYVLYFVANVISLLARPPIQRDSQDRGYESDFIVFVKPGPNIFATLWMNSYERKTKRGTYLDQEEVDSEGGKAPCKLDVLVLGVDLGGAHQRLVVHEDLLLHVLHLHEPEREELLQAGEETQLSF